ncbi:MAG: hypothetical protein K0S07_705 [Chlamydiales bacterium]|jgi:hypothetical protein|nr:hypothetical protein [Chlamydiales bacterium]
MESVKKEVALTKVPLSSLLLKQVLTASSYLKTPYTSYSKKTKSLENSPGIYTFVD